MCKKIDLSNFTSLDCSDGPDPDTQNDRCDFSDNGTSSSRRKIVNRMIARPPATPTGTAPRKGVATSSNACISGWTMSWFQKGSRRLKFNGWLQGTSGGLAAQEYRTS